MHEQKFKDLLSSKCQVSVERIVLDLESEGQGSIPTRGNIFSKFSNPNLHNIARPDRIGFKTKNPNYCSVQSADLFTRDVILQGHNFTRQHVRQRLVSKYIYTKTSRDAQYGTRTHDPQIKSLMLYRLS